MSLIEGIGDEVLHFFVALIIILLGVIAWLSTHISERPRIRTVLILERRSQTRSSNENQQSVNETSIDTGQVDREIENDEGDSSEHKEESESTSSLLLPNEPAQPSTEIEQVTPTEEPSEAQVQPQIVEGQSDESSVLRKRRLAFFQNRGPTLIEPVVEDQTPQSTPDDSENVDVEGDGPLNDDQDQIRIRLKYLNDDQIVVEGRLNEQLGEFKRRHFRIELAAEKMVRLIFNGQVLQCDNQTLQGYGLFDNCVVHCLVHNQRSSPVRTAPGQPAGSGQGTSPPDWNLSIVLYTCLSIILGFAWYCRYHYSNLFSVTTTAALFGLSGIFLVTMMSLYLPDHENLV